MGRAVVLVCIVLGVGCIDDRTVPCGEKRCPAGDVCITNAQCVNPEQLSICEGAAESSACATASISTGQCIAGVCEPIVCGDSAVWGPEVCDDGNQIANDGCSADCRSNETCPNGTIDVIDDEQCDDNNALGGDGCTSLCELEVPTWRDISPIAPSTRYDHAVAYDSVRDRIVMFGGRDGVQNLEDTWELDGAYWRKRFSFNPPQRRSGHAAAFDEARREVVMFGGVGLTGTFTWDGIAWTRKNPTVLPPPRGNAALAYDPIRQRVVLYGGTPNDSDTWLWDGTDWTQVMTAKGMHPPPEVSLAWDPVTERVVAVGLNGGSTMYAWNGTGWTATPTSLAYVYQKIVTTKTGLLLLGMPSGASAVPEMRAWTGSIWGAATSITIMSKTFTQFGMVYDSALDAVFVVFGTDASPRASIYKFAANSWSVLGTTPSTQSFQGGAGVYQPATGRIVKFGGSGLGAVSSLTSEWDGDQWIDYPILGGPQGRQEQAMVALDDRVLMFGGRNQSGTVLDELWEWRDHTWKALSAAPAPRYGAMMFHDRVHDRVIVFGGNDASAVTTNTMWAWDGTQWSVLVPAHAPPARAFAMIAYHRVRDEAVMFGGEQTFFGTLQGDTWIWNGTDWSDHTTPDGPTARSRLDGAYHPLRKSIIMFSGHPAPIDETWEWTGTAWRRIDVLTTVPARRNHITAYDAIRRQLVVHGGRIGGQELTDTAALAFSSASAIAEQCDGNDADNDQKTGCSDEDCWGQCTPMCPPGAPCDPAAPHCGDGACSAIENRRLCPSDCP